MRQAFIALALLILVPSAGEQLSFAPEVGRSCTKTYAMTREMVLDEVSRKMNGEEQGSEAPMSSSRSELRLQVTDEAIEVVDGALAAFRRRFDVAERVVNLSGPIGESEMVYSSPLEDVSVLLVREGAEADWSATFEGEALADDKLLDGLSGMVELDGLLTTSDVEPSDTWAIPPERFFTLLEGFGEMAFEVAGGTTGGHTLGGEFATDPPPEPELDGEFVATYARRKKLDGVGVALIELEFDLRSRKDVTASRQQANDMMGGGQWKVDSAEATVAYEGDGLLTWDRKAGRAVSLVLEFEIVETDTSQMTTSSAGAEHSFEERQVSHGSGKVEYSFE